MKHQLKQKDLREGAAKTPLKRLKSFTRKKLATPKSQKCLREQAAKHDQSQQINKNILINFLPDGTVKSIYYDEFFGKSQNIQVERITDVEFDNATQEWVARLIATGEIISRNKLRKKVLEQEVKIASKLIFNGHQIQPSKIKKNESIKTKKHN